MVAEVDARTKGWPPYVRDPSFYGFAALWLVVLSMPLEYAVRVPPGSTGTRVLGILAAMCGLTVVLIEGRFRKLTWFHLAVGLFFGWAGLTYFWTADPNASLRRLGVYFRFAVLLWLIWQFGTTKERLRALLKAYVYGATILAATVIFNRALGYASVLITGLGIPLRYSAFGMNANDLAIVLVFSAAMSCYLGAREQSTWGIWFFRLHLGLAGLGLLVTGSRGALLAGLCVIVFIPFAFWHLPPRRRMAEIAVRLGLFCTVPFFVPTHTAQRIVSIAKDEVKVGNPSRRVTIWAAALALFREKPLHGVGIGAFPAVSKPYLGKAVDTHNGMLSALVETGIVGLLLFSAFIAILVRQGFRLNHTDRRFWLCLFGVWLIGCSLLPWDDKKVNWFTVGVAASWIAVPVSTNRLGSVDDGSDSCGLSTD